MTLQTTSAWRMKVILSILDKPGSTAIRKNNHGDKFICHSHHMKNGGLMEIRHSRSGHATTTVYRMDIYGEAIGIFQVHGDGSDELLYDRDSGIGDHHKATHDTTNMLEQLSETIAEKEQERAYA